MKCQLCERESSKITKHHLIPKQKGTDHKTIRVCISCSKQIHVLFTNEELKREYNTLQKLKLSPEVQKWIEWVRKKDPRNIKHRRKGWFHK